MSSRRSRIATSGVATGRGDDGTTGLLFGGPRVAKDDLRTEAYGTIDEAVAALGLARVELGEAAATASGATADGSSGQAFRQLAGLLLHLQRELFVVGAELATGPAAWNRLTDGTTRVSEAMLESLETTLAEYESAITMPREFVVPGETRASAALEVARTVVRRAERRTVTLQREGGVAGPWLLPYLNRLADLLWILARAAEQAASRSAVPVRTTRRPARRRTAAGSPPTA